MRHFIPSAPLDFAMINPKMVENIIHVILMIDEFHWVLLNRPKLIQGLANTGTICNLVKKSKTRFWITLDKTSLMIVNLRRSSTYLKQAYKTSLTRLKTYKQRRSGASAAILLSAKTLCPTENTLNSLKN
uniref:Uncharacterized protein n=1 Tax=Romanomermis culicivorax TaxID=13658 RepID=A0A915IA83_ROMCU